nr:protein of unknown function [Cupriavidus taiwanensis]
MEMRYVAQVIFARIVRVKPSSLDISIPWSSHTQRSAVTESITDRSTFLETWQSIVWMGLIRIANGFHTSAVLVYAGISENPAIRPNGL